MKLKKVEIKGFESFALKAEIQFKDGITAIVGPNGSGKSNISDAIRWVLGEQSIKNLRGQKMEDVIFAGTSKRKPLGYCEVTITFDNKLGMIPLEYDEVAVTRRMFRSGESQYFLNKSTCRLKDIRELFMDTGVGKDGYSIIGQGRIEEILSNKPEDRRSIFEEAAGIIKYKSKKTEAERKLEKTEENIIRIKDLIYEIKKQRDVLKVQSEKAKEFNVFYEELKEVEVNLLAGDIKKYKTQLIQIDKEKASASSRLNELIEEENNIELSFNELKEGISEVEKQIELLRDENVAASNKYERDKSELAITREKENFNKKNFERLSLERQNINTKIIEVDSSIKELSDELESENEKYKDVKLIYADSESKFKEESNYLTNKENEIEKRKDDLLNVYNETSDIKSKLNAISSFNENVKKRIKSLNIDRDKFIIKRDENKELLGQEEETLKLAIKTLNRFKNSLIQTKEKLQVLIEDISLVNEDINKDNLSRQSKLSSLNLLKSMEEDYEGYYKGVKSVLVESKKDPKFGEGLVGVVAEMIKVDKKYEKSIEIALGSSGQNIVTENEYYAKKIIEYLKKNKLGRVTCLPLNVIKGRDINLTDMDKTEFNIIGLGHEVVEYESRYEDILKYLLGRTVIVENINSAIEFARKTKHRYRIVTLDGEILNPGGSMSGGSQKGSGVNIINRKNRIEELENDIEKLNDDLNHKNQRQIKQRDSIKSLEKEAARLQEEIKDRELKIYSINNNISNYKDGIIRINHEIEQSKKELTELTREEKNYIDEYEKLNIKLSDIESESLRERDDIKKLISVYNSEKEKTEEKSKNLTDIKIKMNEIKTKIQSLEDRKETSIETKSELVRQLDEKQLSIETNKREAEHILATKDQLKISIEKLDLTQKDMEAKLGKVMDIKKGKMEKFYSKQESLSEINKMINLEQKKINSIEIKLTKISTELKNYEYRLSDEYELSFDQIADRIVDIEDIKKTRIRIKNLKSSIRELGNVNLSSIEEFKLSDERLQFILNQHNDLMEGKDNLNDIIKNMEDKMEKQFLLNFEKINENFIEVFKILFNGGKAELILEDKDDILNTGIEINAQPPGKKLQSLTLLSGGEKSLTAVALLFSILTLKPSPFCILDEIDAALDEANISKYTAYLKNFSYDTQFVLITHRKTTMEIADNLYGVTMEEDGISKLISVKLTDYIEGIAS